MPAVQPSSQTTLVILLGASEWPYSNVQDSPAFARSAEKVRNYFCDPHGFGLPPENWLDLFDTKQQSPNEVDQAIGEFLTQRIVQLKQAETPASDLLFYYIGHGMFAPGHDQAYHLAIRCTRDESLRFSAIGVAALAETLKAKARHLRRVVILDCCFAAESFKYMQAAPDQVALQQTAFAFEEQSRRSGFPSRGTALLGSSGHKEPSLILRDESGTMFSEALIHALTTGNQRQPEAEYLSLYELKTLTEDALENLGEGSAPRPFLSSPDQSDGDVAAIPFFPNGAAKRSIASLSSIQNTREAATRPPERPHYVRPSINFRLIHTFKEFDKNAEAVAFSPDGQLLAGCGHNGWGSDRAENESVKLWNIHTKELLHTLEHFSGAETVAFSPDGQLLASGGGGLHEINLWNPQTGELQQTLREACKELSSIAFSPDGQMMAMGSKAANIWFWNPRKRYDSPYLSYQERQPEGFFVSVAPYPTAQSIAFSPDGRMLAGAFSGGEIRLWNAHTKRELRGIALAGHKGDANSLAFSPDGLILASGGSDKVIKLWNPRTGEHLHTLSGHTEAISSLTFSPDGQFLVSGSFDEKIKCWHPSTGELLHTIDLEGPDSYLEESENWVLSVALSPDGNLLAAGCNGGNMYLWDRAI